MTSGVYKRTPEHCAALSKGQRGVPHHPHTPEHCAALSKAHMGVPKSPKTCASMSAARRNSKAAEIASEAMRGGDDIVDHHMIYDHSDLTKNIMRMTRSMHMMLHRLFQKHGIIIPHVNVQEE